MVGTVLAPILLPWIPGRALALRGTTDHFSGFGLLRSRTVSDRLLRVMIAWRRGLD
jgi:hypothetical protein